MAKNYFQIRKVQNPKERTELIRILSESKAGVNYRGRYDLELVAMDESGTILSGAQININQEGVYKEQNCPTYNIENIATMEDKRGGGLGTALINHLKNKCKTENIKAIAIVSGRASRLATKNGFNLFQKPDFWIWCEKSAERLCSVCPKVI